MVCASWLAVVLSTIAVGVTGSGLREGAVDPRYEGVGAGTP